jgi:hypothetical protein
LIRDRISTEFDALKMEEVNIQYDPRRAQEWQILR